MDGGRGHRVGCVGYLVTCVHVLGPRRWIPRRLDTVAMSDAAIGPPIELLPILGFQPQI